MYRFIPLFVILVFSACSSCTEDNGGDVNIDDIPSIDYSLIQYRGRMEFGSGNTCSFSTPGSSIKLKFKGAELYATFSVDDFGGNGYSYLYIITDEIADPYARHIIRVEKEEQEYKIVDGLPKGEHIVEIVKQNECWGQVHFKGLRIPGGYLLPLPAKKDRLIEYFGDSNPSGWSAWDDKDQGGEDDTEAYFTYPGFTARALDAEWVNFSAGGFGITDRMGQQDLTDYFNNIHIYTNSPETNTWNFTDNNLGEKPDVVVINLGANDHYNNASQAEIKSAWHRFISSKLRPVYPDAHIVLANSYGWAIGEPTDYVDEVIEAFHSNGDPKISCVKFPWLWGQEHAVISEHAGFASILSKHIATTMGWEAKDIPYSSIPEEKGVLGNPSFESSILGKRPDGWRPDDSKSNAIWVMNPTEAKDGNAFLRCYRGYGVHQAVDAQAGEQHLIKVWAKATAGTQGIIKYQYRDQAQQSIRSRIKPLALSDDWQQFELITEQAPVGTWQIDVVLRAEHNATVDYDLIEMTINQ